MTQPNMATGMITWDNIENIRGYDNPRTQALNEIKSFKENYKNPIPTWKKVIGILSGTGLMAGGVAMVLFGFHHLNPYASLTFTVGMAAVGGGAYIAGKIWTKHENQKLVEKDLSCVRLHILLMFHEIEEETGCCGF